MRITHIVAGLMIAAAPLIVSCKGKGGEKAAASQDNVKQELQDKQRDENYKKVDELNHEYPKVPDDALLENGPNTPLYTELKKRYHDDAAKLKQMIEATGAKVVFIMITPEVGKTTPASTYGIPYIRTTCAELGIEYYDFSSYISSQDPHVITQIPRDGHWSKKGAEFIAGHIAPIIEKYMSNSSTVTYKDSERPETFGDLAPNDDEILDGGKDLPYHLKANSQGVRMDHDVKFPKTKKHVLLMGDSGMYCPFLNNEFTIGAVLQQKFPNAEIMNTGMICYTLDDYVSLWNEKAKYSEPDIVIIQTNGGDITDYYFTNRNHLSRSHKPFLPSPNEEKFYKATYAR